MIFRKKRKKKTQDTGSNRSNTGEKESLQAESEERSQDHGFASDRAQPATVVLTAVNTRCFLLLDPPSNSKRECPGELVQILICACLSHSVLIKCLFSTPLHAHKSVLLGPTSERKSKVMLASFKSKLSSSPLLQLSRSFINWSKTQPWQMPQDLPSDSPRRGSCEFSEEPNIRL